MYKKQLTEFTPTGNKKKNLSNLEVKENFHMINHISNNLHHHHGSPHVTQAGTEFLLLLSHLLEYWDYMCVLCKFTKMNHKSMMLNKWNKTQQTMDCMITLTWISRKLSLKWQEAEEWLSRTWEQERGLNVRGTLGNDLAIDMFCFVIMKVVTRMHILEKISDV
jgi:hypothetical protein